SGSSVAESDRGEVVGEGVEPDVHHMSRVVRYRNAPLERRPADAQIFEAGFQKRGHLVPAHAWSDEFRVACVVLPQRLLERRQPEEVALLGDALDRVATD